MAARRRGGGGGGGWTAILRVILTELRRRVRVKFPKS